MGETPMSLKNMDFLKENLLTILIFLPTVGMFCVLMARSRESVKWTALAFTAITFVASLLLFATYDWHTAGSYSPTGGIVQMVQEANWIPQFNIKYKVG